MDVSRPTHLRTGRYSRGFLPHLRAEGRPYFVTFRLEGTLPQAVLQQYQAERDTLCAKAEQQGYQLSWHDQKRLFELYSAKVEAYLDAGYGNCWLRDARLADLVCHALRFFDVPESALGRYALGAWAVMPNHVHVIVRPEGLTLWIKSCRAGRDMSRGKQTRSSIAQVRISGRGNTTIT